MCAAGGNQGFIVFSEFLWSDRLIECIRWIDSAWYVFDPDVLLLQVMD